MRARRFLRTSLGPLAALLTGVSLASASPVILVRPESKDPLLVDAWSRLGAELAIHHFDTRTVDEDLGEEPSRALSEIARREEALACFALVRRGTETVVDVWLVDRITGKTTLRALSVASTDDTPSLLAIRAVDLLRASLAEFEPDERPPPDVVDAGQAAAPPAARALGRRNVALGVSGLVLGEGTRIGFAYAPALSGWFRLAPEWELGVLATGPVTGGRLETEKGSASVQSQVTWIEARFSPFASGRLTAGVNAAFGAHYLRAEGNAAAPLEARTDSAWSFIGALGGHARFLVVPRVYVAVFVRAVGLVPRVKIAVARDSALLPLPMPSASLGLEVEL